MDTLMKPYFEHYKLLFFIDVETINRKGKSHNYVCAI